MTDTEKGGDGFGTGENQSYQNGADKAQEKA